MRGVRVSPATVAAVFSLAVGGAVCFWGYQDLNDSYQAQHHTMQDARNGVPHGRDAEADAASNAEEEPELSETGRNVPFDGPSPSHP